MSAAIAFKALGGSGPSCLLIHGFGSDRMSWLANTPALLPISSPWSLDLPGHGESGMDVGDGSPLTLCERIESAIDKHQLNNLHVIGHSLGGGLAMLLAARRPELVASLILIAPAGHGAVIDADFVKAFPEAGDEATVTTLLQRLVVRPQLMGKQVAQRVLAQLAVPGARDALRKIGAALIANAEMFRAAGGAIGDVPRMVLWGTEDRIGTPDPARLKALGGALHMIEGTGHLPHIEKAPLVNSLITEFLRQQAT